MNKDEKQEYRRYKRYVSEGNKEFLPALMYFENGMSREKPRHQQVLRKLLLKLQDEGMTVKQISKRTGINPKQVCEVVNDRMYAIGKERAELVIKELTNQN